MFDHNEGRPRVGSARSGGIVRRDLIVLLAIVVLAVTVRLPGLFARSIWYDEAITLVEVSAGAPDVDRLQPCGVVKTAFEGSRSLAGITEILTGTDTHPPVYYWVLSLWRTAFGISVEVARTLSLICSVGAVALLFLLLRSAGLRHPEIPTLLYALATSAVHYGHEIRGYALASLLLIGGTALAFHAARSADRPGANIALALGAAFCLSAAGLAGYLSVIPAAFVVGWYVVAAGSVARSRVAVLPAATALIFLTPYLALDLHVQLGARTHQDSGYVGVLREAIGILRSGADMFVTARPPVLRDGMILVLIGLSILTLVRCRRSRVGPEGFRTAMLMSGLALAPPIGLFLLDTLFQKHIYQTPRYLMFAAPGLAFLVTYGVITLRGRLRLAGFVVLGAIVIFQAAAFNRGAERCSGAGRGGPLSRTVARSVGERSSTAALLGVGFGRGDPWTLAYELHPDVSCRFLHGDTDPESISSELAGYRDVWILGASDGQTADAEQRLFDHLIETGSYEQIPYVYVGGRVQRYRHLVRRAEAP